MSKHLFSNGIHFFGSIFLTFTFTFTSLSMFKNIERQMPKTRSKITLSFRKIPTQTIYDVILLPKLSIIVLGDEFELENLITTKYVRRYGHHSP